MLALRPFLRQTHRRPICLLQSVVRQRHDHHGPHKEYFQNPNQQYQLADHHPSYLQQYQQIQQNEDSPPERSRLSRLLRGTFNVTTFFLLGWASGAALITWEYLQPPYEKGSEEDLELYDDIAETLNTCPLVESLREADWREEEVFVRPVSGPTQKGQHMLHQTLDSVQGIAMKLFRHPSEHFTILVFYPGFGCEGWPDVVHGGVITSMMLEGMDKHLDGYADLKSLLDRKISVDFKIPVRPGDIYTVLVPPSPIDVYTDPEKDSDMLLMKVTAFVMQMEAAPQVQSQFDAATNTEHHIIDIPTNLGRDATHAVGHGDAFLVPKDWYDQLVKEGYPDPKKMEGMKLKITTEDSQKDVLAKIGAAMTDDATSSEQGEKNEDEEADKDR